MKYEQYNERESSGVAWLQGVPRHWRIRRLKFSAELINSKVSVEESALPYLGLEHIESWTGRRIDGEINNSEGLASSFLAGDVLFGKLRPYLAKVHLAQQDGLISSEALVVRGHEELHAEFLKYYMLSRDFINIVDSSTYGSKMPRASWDFIGNLPVLLPVVTEQQTIARFLDFKTTQIDALIAKQQALLAKLTEKRTALISHAVTKGLDPSVPMKDSDVEWLGKIPAHWEAKRLKFVVSTFGGGTPNTGKPEYWNGEIPWVSPKDMKCDFIAATEDYLTDLGVAESATKIVPVDSVLIVVRSGILRHTIPVARNTVEVSLNQDMKALVASDRLRPGFIHWFISGLQGGLLPLWSKQGCTVESIEMGYMTNTVIPLPPMDEQDAILENISKITAKIDKQMTKVADVISALAEYRSSLITHAVTGKIDVRNVALPSAATLEV
jgi:type I restriction enzyme S subunit